MNNILIVCDGKEVKIKTKRTVKEICHLIEANNENELLLINSVSLCDREFKSELALKPRKVTLIKDITEKENITDSLMEGGIRITEGSAIYPLRKTTVFDNLAKEISVKLNNL